MRPEGSDRTPDPPNGARHFEQYRICSPVWIPEFTLVVVITLSEWYDAIKLQVVPYEGIEMISTRCISLDPVYTCCGEI